MIILNESKVKYEALDTLLYEQLHDIKFSQSVNIIVDLKEIIKKFFRPDILESIDATSSNRDIVEEISSDVIGVIGHYRNYFYKRGKYTTFYMLYSYSQCTLYGAGYKKDYYATYFTNKENATKINVINRVMRTVEILSNALPGCRFIDTSKYDELVYTKYILENLTKTNEINLILSNDDIMIQCLDKHTFMLNLKGIRSSILDSSTIISKQLKRDDMKFSSKLWPLLLSISGDKKYSFVGIPGIAMIRSAKTIQALLDKNIIIDSFNVDFPIDFSLLDEKNKLEKQLIDNASLITSNYDMITANKVLYKNRISIEEQINVRITKGDYDYFLDMNAKIFNNHPLILNMLIKEDINGH